MRMKQHFVVNYFEMQARDFKIKIINLICKLSTNKQNLSYSVFCKKKKKIFGQHYNI